MKKSSGVLFTISLVISSLIGFLHFFAPYAAGWYSFIPDAPKEIYASIDYVNFFFSLLLTGWSILLILFKKQVMNGSKELTIFYAFLSMTWFLRIIITLVIPWPNFMQPWLLVGFTAQFLLTAFPALDLIKNNFDWKKQHVS